MTACLLAALIVLGGLTPLHGDSKTLTDEDRIEILRGLDAEFAKAKVYLPRSKKPLPFESNGSWDQKAWESMGKDLGPAARVGDSIQITAVRFENDKIILDINGGLKKKGSHWYDHVQVGMGGATRPVSQDQGTNAPGGTYVAIVFPERIPHVESAELKKMLSPIFDFDKHSVTVDYVESLPEPIKNAIKEKRALEGMDRDQVLLALGHPRSKDRQTREGVDYEDWVYGEPPGKITFVIFAGSKVVEVRDEYAGLGGSTVPSLQPH